MLSLLLCFGCDYKHPSDDTDAWKIVQHSNEFAYYNWNGVVEGGFTNYEDCYSAMTNKRAWSQEYNDRFDKEHSAGYWKQETH